MENILNNLNPSVINTIKKLIIETDKQNPKRNVFKKIKARFIPLESMFQFGTTSPDCYPYGQSFIDPLVLQGKLYILSQLSNLIMKLSRAAPIRKWTIDVGPLQNQGKYVQQLRRELYNQRVTVDDVLSFKNTGKVLTEFKDLFVFRKNGVSHLDMELTSLGDPSPKTADLEDARRELISLSGIPAPYLGYGDVVELQAQLVHVNLSFATEIADHQEFLTKELNRLIDKIAEFSGFELKPTEYMSVSLIPPVVLILQLIEMTSGAAQNIISVFQNLQLPVDPISFLKKYVPFIDWDEFEENARKFTAEKGIEMDMKTKSDARLQGEAGAFAQGGF